LKNALIPGLVALMKLSLPNFFGGGRSEVISAVSQNLTAFVLIVLTTTACSGTLQTKQPTNLPVISRTGDYALLARGNSAAGQDFGNGLSKQLRD